MNHELRKLGIFRCKGDLFGIQVGFPIFFGFGATKCDNDQFIRATGKSLRVGSLDVEKHKVRHLPNRFDDSLAILRGIVSKTRSSDEPKNSGAIILVYEGMFGRRDRKARHARVFNIFDDKFAL